MSAGYRVGHVDLTGRAVDFVHGGVEVPAASRRSADAPTRPPAWAPLRELAQRRPVFHSEADFQHELAWQLRLLGWERIRLEVPFRMSEVINLDVFATKDGERLAIELKYWKRGASFVVDGEAYDHKATAADDISRYDFWKDVSRLEALVGAGEADRGLAIALSNPAYWRESHRDTIDRDFRMHEGRVVGPGRLRWAERAGAGTTQGREKALSLRGAYTLQWELYSNLPAVGPVGALTVEVR